MKKWLREHFLFTITSGSKPDYILSSAGKISTIFTVLSKLLNPLALVRHTVEDAENQQSTYKTFSLVSGFDTKHGNKS